MFTEDDAVMDNITINFDVYDIKENYKDFYLNITDISTGLVYSYGIKLDGKSCSGTIVRMISTWEIDHISVSIIGQDMSGNYDAIADISDLFIQVFNKKIM